MRSQLQAIDVAEQALHGLLPLVQQPGFVDHELLSAGARVIAISTWDHEAGPPRGRR
jgi:hypothetical protein